jgi:hypothetical protein
MVVWQAGSAGRDKSARVGTDPPAARPKPESGKFRLDRGPLRFWLIVVGVFAVSYDPLRFGIGLGLVTLGMLLHFASKACLRQNKALSLSGPYRFTRNPFYLATLIAEAGLLVIIGNPWIAAVYGVVWIWAYGRTIREEEAALTRLFGDEYRRYCARVPRMIPLPGRVLPRSEVRGPRFTWKNPSIASGSEIQRVLRFFSYPPLFLASARIWEQGLMAVLNPDVLVLAGVSGFAFLNILGWLITWRLSRRRFRAMLAPPQLNTNQNENLAEFRRAVWNGRLTHSGSLKKTPAQGQYRARHGNKRRA